MRFRKGSILYYISYATKVILKLLSVPCFFFTPIGYILCLPIFYFADANISCSMILRYLLMKDTHKAMKNDGLSVQWTFRLIACSCHLLLSLTYFIIFYNIYKKVYTYAVVISTYHVFTGFLNAYAGYIMYRESPHFQIGTATARVYSIHPQFVKRVFAIFGVYFLNDKGLGQLGWSKYPAAFLPSIVAGYVFSYGIGAGFNYQLDCDIVSLGPKSFCLQNGECCDVVDVRSNLFHFIPNLAGSVVAGYGVVRYLTLFLLGCEHQVNQLDGTRSIMEKFNQHQDLLERFQYQSPSIEPFPSLQSEQLSPSLQL